MKNILNTKQNMSTSNLTNTNDSIERLENEIKRLTMQLNDKCEEFEKIKNKHDRIVKAAEEEKPKLKRIIDLLKEVHIDDLLEEPFNNSNSNSNNKLCGIHDTTAKLEAINEYINEQMNYFANNSNIFESIKDEIAKIQIEKFKLEKRVKELVESSDVSMQLDSDDAEWKTAENILNEIKERYIKTKSNGAHPIDTSRSIESIVEHLESNIEKLLRFLFYHKINGSKLTGLICYNQVCNDLDTILEKFNDVSKRKFIASASRITNITKQSDKSNVSDNDFDYDYHDELI